MQIASITMVGQFAHGIDLHVRNLKWFLHGIDYHIYIVTTPAVARQAAINNARVTFITQPQAGKEFVENPETRFVNFWRWFPTIVKEFRIDPEWFLFMEQDLWFFEQFDSFPQPNTVKTFLPDHNPYHDVMLDENVLQPHIWEGTHLINGAIVQRAIKANIRFAYFAESFLDRHRQMYEEAFGGKLSIFMWTKPETMSEFSLYCALQERVGWEEVEKAVHFRGAEIFHRKYPQIYYGADQPLIGAAQAAVPDTDVYTAIALYYIAGNWRSLDINWNKAPKELDSALAKIAIRAKEWMTPEQYDRLMELRKRLK